MRILHLSTYDTKGGGARSTYRLHQGLLELGVDSKLFVNHKSSKIPSVINYKWPSSRIGRFKRGRRETSIKEAYKAYKSTIPKGFEPFTSDKSANLNLIEQLPDFDLVNMHWVATFIDFKDIFSKIKDKPLVWRLSDMNPITGGCHYDDGCGKFVHGCHTCPQLGGVKKNDLSLEIWNRKKEVISKVERNSLHFVAQSNWMADQIKSSEIFGRFNVNVIPNGLDTTTFQPRDKLFSREIFGVPKDKKVLLFVSDVVTNRRKGFQLLVDALNNLKTDDEVVICAVGNVDVQQLNYPNLIQLGNIGDDRLLSMVYSMADLFVIPSLQDNLPNTVIESLSCGTPVIGFPIGGILDMINDGENGLLTEEVSSASLQATIEKFLNSPSDFDGDKIRQSAVNKYDRLIQAKAMLNLYKRLLNPN